MEATAPTKEAMTIHRLTLTAEQSAFLLERGRHFVVVTPGSYPDAVKRHVLFLVECGQQAAADACEVALGRAKIGRQIRQAKIEPPPAE